MTYYFRKLLVRFCVLIFILCFITLIVLLSLTSLYKTIPANIPFFTSIPNYRNKWQYTPPTHLTQPNPQLTAAYITFVRGDTKSLSDLRLTMRYIEDVFNQKYNYPYIIFTNDDLTTEFKELVASVTKSDVQFEKVSKYDYGYGNKTDQFRAYLSRNNLKDTPGNTEQFRFKSRLMAGTIYNHKVFEDLEYFWRFEPGTEYMCPIDFDPFQYMKDNNKELSFSLASYELEETMPSLFNTVTKFKKQNPNLIINQKDSLMPALLTKDGEYNRCYLWNNFQIAKTSFFTSPEYKKFFEFIDKEDGIFYERWADPVIQSLGAALFLNRTKVQMWQDIGYRYRFSYAHCPSKRSIWEKCACRPTHSFDSDGLSCLSNFL